MENNFKWLNNLFRGIKPSAEDLEKIENNEYERAGGECICDLCLKPYRKHLSFIDYNYLTRLCNGKIVKL